MSEVPAQHVWVSACVGGPWPVTCRHLIQDGVSAARCEEAGPTAVPAPQAAPRQARQRGHGGQQGLQTLQLGLGELFAAWSRSRVGSRGERGERVYGGGEGEGEEGGGECVGGSGYVRWKHRRSRHPYSK